MTHSARVLYLGAGGTGMGNATGQTLRSLLSGLSDDRLLQAVYEVNGIETRVLAIPESVALIDVVLRAPIRFLRRVRGVTPVPNAQGLNDAIKVSGTEFRTRIWRSLRAAADIAPVRLPERFVAEIRRFEPDVIYTLLGNVRMMKLAVELSKKLDIPIVPHFMDDWGGNLYPNGELGGFARRSVSRSFDRVITRSPNIVCIGERMAEEYRSQFARDAFVAAFGVDDSSTDGYTAASGDARTLVYTGGLHLGREAVIKWIASALQGTAWRVEVYAPSRGAPHPNITYRATVSVRDIGAVLASADALLFVESLDEAIADYTRLSVSTKVAQYVAANHPTVLVGPKSQASIQVLKQHLHSQILLTSLDERETAALRGYLVAGLPATIPGRRLPVEFTAEGMRNSLERAIGASVSEWRTWAGRRG